MSESGDDDTIDDGNNDDDDDKVEFEWEERGKAGRLEEEVGFKLGDGIS